MPVAKLRASSSPNTMKSDAGNDSLDTFIRQAIGKEPFLSFSRTGDSPVQWIQLLHAIDQQDLPGWPLLSPMKVQMQKCDKCSREFCSPINYRRHIRVHRRSLNVDKESHKNRDLLGAFWNKLSLEEARDILSFKDVTLEEVPGSSIIRTLTSFIRKSVLCGLPPVYVRAGSALLDIIQAKPSSLPISSQDLFSLLDDASERTFLCAGTAESMQKYVFDGEAGKIGLETKNLVACTSFLLEQKLVKAWLADKDAEALRCQKLLVEEEEAAQKRLAEMLEKKRQKKLRKEQRVKEQPSGENSDVKEVVVDTPESPPSEETSSSPAVYEFNSDATDLQIDPVTSPLEPVYFQSPEEADIEAQFGFAGELSDSGTQNVERRSVQRSGRRHLVVARWQVPKSQRGGRNGFHPNQNPQLLKPEHAQKHSYIRDARASAAVNGNKVWARKPKPENDAETLKTRLHEDAVNQADQSKKPEVMIGSISVTLGNCTSRQQGNDIGEAPDSNCSTEHASTKENIQEKHPKVDSPRYSTNHSSVKLWRPVSRHDSRGPMPVQSGSKEFQMDVTAEKGNDRTIPSESCQQSSAMDNNGRDNGNNPIEQSTLPDGSLFAIPAAKAFLAQRWKEAIAGEHVKLVLSTEPEPPGLRNPITDNDCQVTSSSLDSRKHNGLANSKNQVANVEAPDSISVGGAKAKFRTQPDKSVKIKYIPKQKTVA